MFSMIYSFLYHFDLIPYFSSFLPRGSVVSNSFVNSWTTACQVPLSIEFPKQEYWSGLPFPVSLAVVYGCESWTMKKAEQ